jgi:tetratricopeptide (TPR) repeat protein
LVPKVKAMTEIEALLDGKKWKTARARIQEELLASPSDHWLWMHLGLTYYEEKDYEKALACSKRAVELEPNCALALWHYAGSLVMTGKETAAVAIWTLLLDLDPDEIANGECGEGMDWALQLINDVHYRMGRYFEHKGRDSLARASYDKYLHNRAHGVGSIYDAEPVKKRLGKPVPAAGSNPVP